MSNRTTTMIVVAILAVLGLGAIAFTNGNDPKHKMPDDKMTTQNEAKTPATNNSAAQETNDITYKNFAVVQKAIKVKKGTTVTWTNEDNTKHDVTPVTETEEFKTSKLFGKGEKYSVTFNTVGKYSYFCSPHPYMKGTIEVTE